VFAQWQVVNPSKYDGLVTSIRTRKGLKPEVPPLDTYYDKL
jgi:elongation factor 2